MPAHSGGRKAFTGSDSKPEPPPPPRAAATRFGAVKIYAAVLSQAVDVKTYVVTNQTTARDLVTIVLNSYKVICEHPGLFCLVLERVNKTTARSSASPRYVPLADDDKPLEIQGQYARGDTRFCLQARQGVGIVTVNDKAVQNKDACLPSSRSVFLTGGATCRDLVKLILDAHTITDSEDCFSVFEVDSNSKAASELCQDHKPLMIQQQWLDPYEYFFEVRRRTYADSKTMRRTHSLTSLEDLNGPKRILNIREVRKLLTPKRGWRHDSQQALLGTNDLTASRKSEEKETTVAKLRDNLTRLREHLDQVQRKRSRSYDGDLDAAALQNGAESKLDTSNDILDRIQVKELPGDIIDLIDPSTNDVTGGNPTVQINSEDVTTSLVTSSVRGKVIGADGYYEKEEGVVMRSMEDDTGESLNESDAGSPDSPSYNSKRGGTNDSAYASDRQSYTSTHRRRRRTSCDSSEYSSPETDNGLRKAHSLVELEADAHTLQLVETRPRPYRVRSASHAQIQARALRIATGFSGSDDQLNSWDGACRNNRRNVYNADVLRRSQSMQFNLELTTNQQRPTSAESNRSTFSNSSARTNGSKIRRSLPKIPQAIADEIEERKKRISAHVIKKAETRSRSRNSQRLGRDHETGHGRGRDHGHGRDREQGGGLQAPHQRAGSPAHYTSYHHLTFQAHQPHHHHHMHDDANCDSDESEFVNEINLDSRGPTPLKTGLEEYYEQLSNDASPPPSSYYGESSVADEPISRSQSGIQNFTTDPYNGQYSPQEYDGNYTPQNHNGPMTPQNYSEHHTPRSHSDGYTPHSFSDHQYTPRSSRSGHSGHSGGTPLQRNHIGSSKEQLQRIINDLKDAAHNPYDNNALMSRDETGSGSGGSSRDQAHDYPYDYAQLAQWGVLEPSYDDLIAAGVHRPMPLPANQVAGGSPEIQITHPSIYYLLQTCELVRIVIERHRNDPRKSWGVEVFESVFSDSLKEKSRRQVFRSPSGRKPVIGRQKGAFQPVPSGVGDSGKGKVMSMVAIDSIDEDGPAMLCGNLYEGDYIVEVNGKVVTEATPEQVKQLMEAATDLLELVIARPRSLSSSERRNSVSMQDLSNLASSKEVEKLKLKYSAMKLDSEKNMDMIADLKIELKEKDQRILDLENELSHKGCKLQTLEKIARKREEEANDWKYEANHRNMELSRLKFENKQKEDRISQLRHLLIQQTELMQMQQQKQGQYHPDRGSDGSGGGDPNDFISAV